MTLRLLRLWPRPETPVNICRTILHGGAERAPDGNPLRVRRRAKACSSRLRMQSSKPYYGAEHRINVPKLRAGEKIHERLPMAKHLSVRFRIILL